MEQYGRYRKGCAVVNELIKRQCPCLSTSKTYSNLWIFSVDSLANPIVTDASFPTALRSANATTSTRLCSDFATLHHCLYFSTHAGMYLWNNSSISLPFLISLGYGTTDVQNTHSTTMLRSTYTQKQRKGRESVSCFEA